jgi:hypothetical protein
MKEENSKLKEEETQICENVIKLTSYIGWFISYLFCRIFINYNFFNFFLLIRNKYFNI